MNNPNGADSAGQGSVPRPGLVALDPQNGIPLKWNPGRNPRGEAAYEIYETDAGLWITSDTDWIGDRRYQRPRIAFFPYDEGSNTASKGTGALPGNVYVASPNSNSSVVYRVNAGGAAIVATDGGPDWAVDTTAAPSALHNTGSTAASAGNGNVSATVNVPATTPITVFNTERNDGTTAPEMLWSFPVPAGQQVQVRLYMANRGNGNIPARIFNVAIDGVAKLTNYNLGTDAGGNNRGIMKSFDITSDGTVNVDFAHVTGGNNPVVNAIEIVRTVTIPNATAANVVSFDGTTVNSQVLTATAGFDWTNVRSAVMIGHTLFYGQSDNFLYRRSFDGVTFGPATQVNPYIDPLWNTVLTGSGPVTQTYTGVLPAWYGQLSTDTGMFYANGRIYYTKTGQNSLYWRWFSPDSGIVGGVESTVAGGNITWSTTKGMFLDGSTLYVVNSTNGQLLKIPFVNGAPSGTSSVANSTMDWRGKAVFLAAVLPNAAPSAAFTWNCTGISCTFDGTGSADSDGAIQSYEWTFGDGDEAGSATPQKDFLATGTYDVTLTVTDDGGLSNSVTHQVSVVKPNVPPTAAFTTTCDYLDCDFDGTTSSDSDGTVDDYAWDFGDGETGTGSTPNHVYEDPGTYTTTLVVTDNEAATDDASSTQVVVGAPAASTVSYVGGAVNQGNVTTPNVTTPTTVSAGDRLVMVLTLNASNRVLSDPTGITGWTVLDTTTSGSMQTRALHQDRHRGRREQEGHRDPGRGGQVHDDRRRLLRRARRVAGLRRRSPRRSNQAGHATPTVDAPAGSWVVSYWADKSTATTAFALPGSVTGRHALCGTGSGHVCSSLADSNGAVPTGQYGGLVATADTRQRHRDDVVDHPAHHRAEPGSDGGVHLHLHQRGLRLRRHRLERPGRQRGLLRVGLRRRRYGDRRDPEPRLRDLGDPRRHADGDRRRGHDRFGGHPGLGGPDQRQSDGVVHGELHVPRTAASTRAPRETATATSRRTRGTSATARPTPRAVSTSSHTYDAAGPYVVTLTVTDNDDGTGSTTRNIAPVAVRPIALVGSNANQGNVATPNTIVPAATAAGDRLLHGAQPQRRHAASAGTPTSGVTGWTLVDTATSGTMQTIVYTKVAAPGDGGKTVRFTMDAAAKYTLTVAVYTGDMLAPQFAKASETVVQARPHHSDARGRAPETGRCRTGPTSPRRRRPSRCRARSPSGRRSVVPTLVTSAARSRTPTAECPQARTAPWPRLQTQLRANATMWTVLLRQAA